MTGDTHGWWGQMLEQSDTPLSKLVDNFDAIATQAIPYAQLPTRAATAYSDQLRYWSDLGDTTIHSLTEWPKSGVATVRSLIGAARDASAKASSPDRDQTRDAVSAANRLLAVLTERDRRILDSRVWARHPLTQLELADQLGKNGTWIYRNQPRAEARFAELCANPLHRDLIGHAGQLRLRIGAVAREHTVTAALAEIGLQESEAGRMLLHLAGPYQPAAAEGWWENDSTGGWAGAVKAVDAVLARAPAPDRNAFVSALVKAGVQRELADDVVDSQPGLRRFGDKWVRWGTNIADKAAAILHVDPTHTPVTSDAIATAIGENHHERAVSQALFGHRRFARASRQTWALRQWRLPEYSGVFNEIAQRIDAAGGKIAIAELVRDITAAFPDVAETSVRTYIGTPAFIVKDSTVRRRTSADSWREIAPLNKARGAYRNRPNQIRLAMPVTKDVLRGSGQPIHPAVAGALGILPGQQRRFTGLIDIVIRWQLSSARGPSVGTLRPMAAAVEAVEGDELVLALNSKGATVEVGRIAAGDNLHQRLQMLIARPSPNPLSAIATSLGCRRNDVITLLRQRGDTELADLLDEETTHG